MRPRQIVSDGSISWRTAVRRGGVGVDYVRRIAAPAGQPPFVVGLQAPGEAAHDGRVLVRRFPTSEAAATFRRTIIMVRAARLFVGHRTKGVPDARRLALLENVANHTERAVALDATNDELHTLATRILREWRASEGRVNGAAPDEIDEDLPPLQPNGLMAKPVRLEP